MLGCRVVLVVVNLKMDTIELDAAAISPSRNCPARQSIEDRGSLVAGYEESDKWLKRAWDTKQ